MAEKEMKNSREKEEPVLRQLTPEELEQVTGGGRMTDILKKAVVGVAMGEVNRNPVIAVAEEIAKKIK